ncbi:PKD domain-containing protein [Flavitalea flava]
MKRILPFLYFLFSGFIIHAQAVLSLSSDTVKISSSRDSGELVIRNRTRNVPGVLYNKGNGTTEFRELKFIRVGDSTLLILGKDTVGVGLGTGGGGSVYAGEPDIQLSVEIQDATHMKLHWWKTNADLYESPRIGVIGDSQGKGDFASAYPYSIVGRLQSFIYASANNPAVTNYSQNGYNSRRLAPTGSNQYVDNQYNITKALADGNKIIILCNTSNDFFVNGAGGVMSVAESMANTLLINDVCVKAGATLFVVSSFPRQALPSVERDSLNVMAGLLNQKFGNRCAYVYHLIEDPASPNHLNPAWQVGDDVHLNNTGANVVYSAIRDMLTSYYTANTSVTKYQLQKSSSFNGKFADYQYVAKPNDPNLVLPPDSSFYRVRLAYNNGYFSKWSNVIQGVNAHQDSVYNKVPLLSVNKPQIVFLPVNSGTLTADASDPNTGGTIAIYNWFKVLGNVATIVNANSANATVTGLVEGTYVFRCQVTNNFGLSSYADATITVFVPDSNNTASKFNFNLSPQNISGWLDVSGGPFVMGNNGASWTSNINNITLVNKSNLESIWGSSFYGNTGSDIGQAIPDGGGFPISPSVLASGWYSNNMAYLDAGSNQMKLTGLSPAKKYKLKFYSSLKTSANLAANPTVFVVNDNVLNKKQVNAVGNTSNVVIFRAIIPDVNGEVPFFVGIVPGVSQYGMVNGLTVQEDSLQGAAISPVVTPGTNAAIQLPNNIAYLSATVADADGAIVSVKWIQVSGPDQAHITDDISLNTTVTNLSQGTYVFRCTAMDNYNATGYGDMQVVVSPPSTNPILNVGVSQNSNSLPGWTFLAGSPHQAVISDTGRIGSTIVTVSTVSGSNHSPYLGNFTAANTGETNNDGGGFIMPLLAQQGNYFNENAFDPAKPQIQITGLPSGTYKVTMFGSLQSSYTSAHGVNANTEYRVNSASPITVNAAGNTSQAAVFTGISVTGGTMKLYYNPTTAGSDSYLGVLCFFSIEKTN